MYGPRRYRGTRRRKVPIRIRRRGRFPRRYRRIFPRKIRRARKYLRRVRRRRTILSAKMLARTKGVLRWISSYSDFFKTLYNNDALPAAGIPTDDGLYTAIRVLTKTCWAAARYVYKFRRHFRVFPKLYEINKPIQNDAHRLSVSLEDKPTSLAVAREFYTLVKLMKKPNPAGDDWKKVMENHQSAGSLTVVITAAALSSTKLENLMSNLFPQNETKILGLIVVSQLIMLKLLTENYNIIKLTGMIKRFPAFLLPEQPQQQNAMAVEEGA